MKFQRYGAVAGVAVAAALALSACGSNNNSTSSTSTSSAGSTGSSASSCPSGTLNAAGSTAQANAISQFTKDYQTKCSGVTVNYNANGSGAGVTAFIQKQADFAGSDYALSTTQATQVTTAGRCGTGKAVNIPAVAGAIAVIYNVPGVTTSLNLSAKNLAAIFDGTITTWNDAAIAKDNPGVTLPSTKIQPFYRSDTSGTSYNFSNYLNNLGGFAAANKQWPGKSGQGAKGSSAVAAKVKATQGGIGYAEYSYATQNSLTYANVSNAAGSFVKLTQANAANFIAKAKVCADRLGHQADVRLPVLERRRVPGHPGDLRDRLRHRQRLDPAALIKGFLSYVVSNTAQSELTGLGYVPLPASVQSADATAISSLS